MVTKWTNCFLFAAVKIFFILFTVSISFAAPSNLYVQHGEQFIEVGGGYSDVPILGGVIEFPPEPSIRVLTPAENDILEPGTANVITWNRRGNVGPVVTVYARASQAGLSDIPISENVSNTGSCLWIIPDNAAHGRYQVIVKSSGDSDGDEVRGVSGEFSVGIPPSKAVVPCPPDHSGDNAVSSTISWTGSDNATTYDVYFGTVPDLSDAQFKCNQTGTTYDPGPLSYGRDYYWRIDVKNAAGTVTGEEWHFTTLSILDVTPADIELKSAEVCAPFEGSFTIKNTGEETISGQIAWMGFPVGAPSGRAWGAFGPISFSETVFDLMGGEEKNIHYSGEYPEVAGSVYDEIFIVSTGGNARIPVRGVVTGGRITGSVRGADGHSVTGVQVYAVGGLIRYNARVEADGSYVIYDLPSGLYRVYVEPHDTDYIRRYYNGTWAYSSATSVEVTAGQVRSEIDFDLDVGSTITGVVTDSHGQPVEGLKIDAEGESDGYVGSFHTRADGAYVIKGLPSGKYRIRLGTDDTEYIMSSEVTVEVAKKQTISGIDLDLVEGGEISGVVRDSDGKPVDGSRVYAGNGLSDYWALSQSDGSYVIKGLPSGDYRVYTYLYRTRHIRKYYKDADTWDSAALVEVAAGQKKNGIDFDLPEGGRISGIVRAPDGRPVKGVRVSIDDESGYNRTNWTKSNGSYVLKGLPPGSYRITVVTYGMEYTSPSRPTVKLAENQTISGMDFDLVVGGEITGVVRATDGQPLEGVWVSAEEESGKGGRGTQTQADGSYILKGLAAGNHLVSVSAVGTDYLDEYYKDAFVRNSAVLVEIATGQVKTGVDFDLSIGGGISGVVRASDGQPLEGVSICAVDDTGHPGGSVDTQADGSYVIKRLASGSYRVVVEKYHTNYIREYYNNAYAWDLATQVEVVGGELRGGIDFHLSRGSTISGVIRGGDGNLVGGLRIDAYDESTGYCRGIQTREDGSYAIKGLPAGNYHIRVQTQYSDFLTLSNANIEVPEKEIVSGMNLNLVVGGRITGTITRDSDGAPRWGGGGNCPGLCDWYPGSQS